MHIEKIKDFIEKNNNNIFIEAYGNGYAACNYRCEIKGERLTCYYESGEEIFSVCENWFHHNSKGKHKEFIDCDRRGINQGYNYYKMGFNEKGKPFLFLYMLDSLQYVKAIEIYNKDK